MLHHDSVGRIAIAEVLKKFARQREIPIMARQGVADLYLKLHFVVR